MKRYPVVLTIAGSDCIGGNGAQADIKTISALGAYAACVITALTVGDTVGLRTLFPIPQEVIKKQIETVIEDIHPDVVKLGLLNDVETIKTVGDCLRKYHPRYVVYDPVMLSDDGVRFMLKKNIKVIERELLPYTNMIIVNRQEAELLSGRSIKSVNDMRKVAELLTQRNGITIVIKSSDLFEKELYDVLRTHADEERVFKSEMIFSHNSHGASCTFSSAIAAYLALEHNIYDAVTSAREFVRQAIIYGDDVFIGHGKGPVCQTFDPQPMKIVINKKL